MSSSQQPNILTGTNSLKRPIRSNKAEAISERRQRRREEAVEKCGSEKDAQAASVQALRESLLGQIPAKRASDNLVTVCNEMRQLDGRWALDGASTAIIHLLPVELVESLLKAFIDPLGWSPASCPAFFKTCSGTLSSVARPDNNLAEFYIRRFAFASHDELRALLEKVAAISPHYASRIRAILDISSSMSSSASASRSLLYAGMTVANSPVGREAADAAKEGGCLIGAVEALYEGTVEVYAVPHLSFRVGLGGTHSVKASREEPRLELHESLLIDSLGFSGLNIASAGNVLRFALSGRIRDLKADLAEFALLRGMQ